MELQKLSNLNRPVGMSLEEWQIALRRQSAEKESFNIIENVGNEETGYYSVYNPRSKNLYKVIYRGPDSRWNYCACMDFKSNCLGTCKHIEAVKLWMSANHKVPVATLPAFTSVYLSYRCGRAICIRYGTDNRADFERLAASYFDDKNELLPHRMESFSSFLLEARKINNTFRCYPDVLQYIVEFRDKQRRAQLVKEHCGDDALNGLLGIQLYPYQKEGIRFAVAAGKCIIADEMGLGKTIQAIGAAEVFRREGLVSSALIICPTSLKYQWKKEIEKVTDTEVVIVEGNQLQRKNHYSSPEFYKIVSYNSASNDIKLYGSLRTDMLIMDEAQRLKNWNTQIARTLRRIDSTYTIILSGTPLENKLQELYSIVQFVDQYCLGPYYRFMDFTTILSPDNGQVVGYKNLNAVGQMLAHILIRRTKKEVAVQLPARTDKNLFVPMTREQRVMHDDFHSSVIQIVAKWQKMQFLNEIDRKRLLLLLSQMRMVCDSTFVLDERSRHDTKIDELINIVKEVVECGHEKMVVFSQWERMTRLVCMELDRLNIGYTHLNGSVPSGSRRELIERFSADDTCRVFVSTDAGSTGLNLQSASILVNLDIPWNPALLEQRAGRIYRIGQHRNVQIINFVAERTIEERMLSTLDFKANVAHGVLDSGADNVFLDDKRFNLLMDSLGCIITPEKSLKTAVISEEAEQMKPAQPVQTSIDFGLEDMEDVDASASVHVDVPKFERKVALEKSAQDMLQQGVSFVSKLSDTLTSPDKTAALLDTIVRVDPETGKTKLEIPVPDKKTVEQMLRLFSRLFLK